VSFGQLYRDRGDSENIFDELKTMGLGRLRHADLARCRLAARMIACFTTGGASSFVWSSRPAYGGHHQPALLLHAIATRVRHARQTTITVASSQREGASGREAFRAVAIFCAAGKKCRAVDGLQRWRRISREPSKFPSGPSVALAATPRTRLTQQLLVENHRNRRASNSNCRI